MCEMGLWAISDRLEGIFYEGHGFIPRADPAVQLGLLDGVQNCFERRARRIAKGDQVLARQEARRSDLLRRGLGEEFTDHIVVLQMAVTRQAVEAVEFQMLLEAGEPHKTLESRASSAGRP